MLVILVNMLNFFPGNTESVDLVVSLCWRCPRSALTHDKLTKAYGMEDRILSLRIGIEE